MTGKPRAQQARRRASAAVPRAAGGTKQHIAEHLGVSTDTVRRDLGPLRPRARRNAVIHKRAHWQARAALAQAHRGGYVRFNTSARARTEQKSPVQAAGIATETSP
jgi:DeoR-like helix-turn-helix domain